MEAALARLTAGEGKGMGDWRKTDLRWSEPKTVTDLVIVPGLPIQYLVEGEKRRFFRRQLNTHGL